MPTWMQQPIKRIAAGLKADPRKTGVMSVLAAVLIVVVARQLIGSSRPAAAMASLLQVGRPNAAPVKQSPSYRNVQALTAWRNQPAANIGRNLFATRLEYFPTDNSKSATAGASDDFWSELGKSIAQATDEETKRGNLKESFRLQAGKLRLQSTMAGPTPRAILNGKLVSEGSVVESFRVERIEARRLILEREGLRFELAMK